MLKPRFRSGLIGRPFPLQQALPWLVGLAVFVVIGLATTWLTLRTREQNELVQHTLEVLQKTSTLDLALTEAASGQRAYLLTRDENFLPRSLEARQLASRTLAELRALTTDNEQQRARVAVLSVSVRDRLETLAQGDKPMSAEEMVKQVVLGRRQIDVLRDQLAGLRTVEYDLLQERRARAEAAGVWLLVLAFAGLATGAAVVTGIIRTLSKTAKSLEEAHDAVSALNKDLEDRVQQRTAALTEANEEIQRFAYIVSHDLRAPLVNIMGFTAELDVSAEEARKLIETADEQRPGMVTAEQRTALLEDLPESLGFIRASTDRMDRLIKAILALSRNGRRTLSAEEVDMSALVEGIVTSLQQQIAETGTEVKIGQLPPVESDRLALEQIFGNLIDNALKYLRPGVKGEISVESRVEGRMVHFFVSDNGRGIAASDHERVFDLFRRAGTQDRPGEGLGLAHVRALVRRLGGRIKLASTLGEGSVFTISLPRNMPASLQQAGVLV